VIEYLGTTSSRKIESIDLRSDNGRSIHLVRIAQPRDASGEVGRKQQLRRGHGAMATVDCAGGATSNRAETLGAAGRVDRASFTKAAEELGIATRTKLNPQKTLEMFVCRRRFHIHTVPVTQIDHARPLQTSVMGIRAKDARS
jgi:hypothetical protein